MFGFLIESLTGSIRVSSLFPQYFITAMLTGAVHVTRSKDPSEPMLSGKNILNCSCTGNILNVLDKKVWFIILSSQMIFSVIQFLSQIL